jgi:plastocyanin/cytochrome c5
MVAGRLKPITHEWAARLLVALLLAAVPLALIVAARAQDNVVTLHASMPESGGWQPGHLSASVGQPLRLRLISDDVIHGFAVGAGPDGRAHNSPEVEVRPGQVTELTLIFDQPGTYTYTCTRWCGSNHWRMRGAIEVAGDAQSVSTTAPRPPLYQQLGLDIDAPHPSPVVPAEIPSALRGARLDLAYPEELVAASTYMSSSPVEVWLTLRDLPKLAVLDDRDLWDVVAYIWRQNTTPESLELGGALYSQNCAACHGENGQGDGVFAPTTASGSVPAFTDPALLAASNALLEGKILRGGMGTGMPAWGAVFSDGERQALLDYLWTFHFPEEGG